MLAQRHVDIRKVLEILYVDATQVHRSGLTRQPLRRRRPLVAMGGALGRIDSKSRMSVPGLTPEQVKAIRDFVWKTSAD
jgi:hypothetical protein